MKGRGPALLVAVAALAVVTILALSVYGLCSRPRDADVAIVLGSAVTSSGAPSPRLRARLDQVKKVWPRHCRFVLVSGGLGREGVDESRVMRDYLISLGLPPNAILRDSLGITTFATAVNARRIMDARGLRTAIVVSQYFHIARAELACRRAGIDVRGGSAPWYFEARDLWSIPREVIGLISYSLRPIPGLAS